MNRHILLPNPLLLLSRFLVGALIFYIPANPAHAQQVVYARAGMITDVEGEVYRDDAPLLGIGKEFVKLGNGQTLDSRMGRAELLLAPNTYLRIGENSSLRMERNLLEDTRLVLERGSAFIEVVRAEKASLIQVRCGAGLIEISRTGLYRIDAVPGELKVYAGAAEVSNGRNEVSVKRGRAVRLDRDPAVSKFDPENADSLHAWAAGRSFYFFTKNSKCGWHMRNWVPAKEGGMYNAGFRMRFYWKSFLDGYVAQQEVQPDGF